MAEEIWTIRRVLQWTQGFFREKALDSPRLDAELIIGDALKLDRIFLYTDLDRPLSAAELTAIRDRVRRRGRHEPVAYITGKRGFWKLDLSVGPGVLVPRPDTERLVELAALLDDHERLDELLKLAIHLGTQSPSHYLMLSALLEAKGEVAAAEAARRAARRFQSTGG